MLFHRANSGAQQAFYDVNILSDLFQFGGLSSPLYRIVREERKLVYQTFCFGRYSPERNYFGFCALAKKENIEALLTAFRDVAKDQWARSRERLEEVQQGVKHLFNMRSIDPSDFRDTAVYRYTAAGDVVNDSDYEKTFSSVALDQVTTQLNLLNPESAHTLVFKGLGK